MNYLDEKSIGKAMETGFAVVERELHLDGRFDYCYVRDSLTYDEAVKEAKEMARDAAVDTPENNVVFFVTKPIEAYIIPKRDLTAVPFAGDIYDFID